jgi:hypothetical protein
MQYNNNDERPCAICQSIGMTFVTWDKVPLCQTHWQEREDMQLGSDQMFRHRPRVAFFEGVVQQPAAAATMSGALCA